MKVVLVGKFSKGSLESSYLRAFRSFDVPVEVVDLQKFYIHIEWWLRSRLGHRVLLNNFKMRRLGVRRWIQEIGQELKKFAPDLVIFFNGHFVFPELVESIQDMGARCGCYFADNPLPGNYNARPEVIPSAKRMDFFWVWSPELAQQLRSRGIRAEYLPFAWDPDLHPSKTQGVGDDAGSHDVEITFIGTWDPEREEILEMIAAHFDLKIWGSDYWQKRTRRGSLVRKAWQGNAVTGAVAAEIYRKSKINLNFYRRQHFFGGEFNGTIMRNFEVPGAGGFLLSPENPVVEELFPKDFAGIYFNSLRDCLTKIDSILNDQSLRERIIENAHSIVAGSHTYRHRVIEILENFK